MKLYFFAFVLIAILLTSSASCTSGLNSVQRGPISLASFSENYVDVSISLERDSAGNYMLSAVFTPPEGYHLYSKDIPSTGIQGLGRPTLLELTMDSEMRAIGELTENVKAQVPDFEPKELLVYPLGVVTLGLPVELPAGEDWVNDELKITFMACSASQCKPPVVGKIVSIRIPGADAIK